ncbi:MAG: hypothetical protein KGJ57_04485 [Sphingomonadales bacterium]|nr:hypothetical protein [Sphingomonadales bacterium]MDE2168671.1 hypothetical protein [Sphingomonadales bacterium]
MWDRFGHWPRIRALAGLVALVLMLAASAIVPLTVGHGEVARPAAMTASAGPLATRGRDADLALYDRVIARLRRGEPYYPVVAQEQRRGHYPLRPGLAVRLPTLAVIEAAIGGGTQGLVLTILALALMLGVVAAWWGRLGQEGCSPAQRRMGTALMFLGASLGLNRYFFVLHELWAGMLLALALGLHRPGQGRWRGAWLAAALALAIREHSLPFVLLMMVMAFWRREWREGAAWGALIALFGVGLAWHLHRVAAVTMPGDPLGPSWFAMRGLAGWLSNVVLSSNLRFLPHWLAGPLVVAMMLGWAGWRSACGATATLLFLGYGLLFMVAGRDDNFYWGLMIAPAMVVGLAFAPMAGAGLWRAVWIGGRGF